MSFGVESVAATTLKKVGRRPILETISARAGDVPGELGIVTAAFYVLGFLRGHRRSRSPRHRVRLALWLDRRASSRCSRLPGTPLFKR
jgi:hypothetical protein